MFKMQVDMGVTVVAGHFRLVRMLADQESRQRKLAQRLRNHLRGGCDLRQGERWTLIIYFELELELVELRGHAGGHEAAGGRPEADQPLGARRPGHRPCPRLPLASP